MLVDKTVEKGLLIVHTGKGKGKSTAAWGLMLRALGRGFRIGVVQFGKGAWETCLLYTSPSPRDATLSRMPSSA